MSLFFVFKNVGESLLEILSRWGYGGVFVLGALDRITISLIPTEILLPMYGILISSGRFELWLTFGIISFGALAGELVLFWLSAKLGRIIIEKWGRYFFVSGHDLEHLDRLFEKYGSKIVFWARLLPVGRAIIAIPAGIARVNPIKFAVFSFFGMLPYNFLFLYLGVKAGDNLQFFLRYFSVLEKFAYVVLVAFVVLYIYRHLKNRHMTHNN